MAPLDHKIGSKKLNMRTSLLLGGGLIRVLVIVYGVWQDSSFPVKFTDVDYKVFTDAAQHISMGHSPYERTTYRYTPLLAMMLVPNIWVHHVFGKLLFAASDLFLAQVIDKVLLLKGCRYSEWWACTWLFHPLAVIISSRGNADSLICLMVVQTALHLEQHNWMLAGVWFGLSVHFKIFPIVFAPSILLFIGHSMKKDTRVWWLKSVKERIVFTIFSAGIFLGLGVLFYIVYGWIFVYEGLYLEYGSTNTWSSVVAFFPQLIVQICFSASFYQDIILCMCLQTLAFVCFNKVSTAQYFIWYISLLPLVLPFSNIKIKWTGAILIVLWIASELNWLYWAYLLEFEGQNTFIQVWISSIVFFLVNGFLLCLLIKNQL